MAETGTATGTPAAPDATPPAGDTPAQAADATPPAGADSDPTNGLDSATLARELASARREAAGYRTRLKTLEDKDKSESEKQQERIAELEREKTAAEQRAQTALLRAETYTVAQKLGFRNPSLASRLIDPASVTFGDDESPKNITALLQQVAKDDPYLTTATTDYGGGPRGSAPTPDVDMNDRIRRAAQRGH